MSADNDNSVFATRLGATTIAACLVHRLGGRVVLTQEDLNAVAYTTLMDSNKDEQTGATGGNAVALWIEQPSKGAMQ